MTSKKILESSTHGLRLGSSASTVAPNYTSGMSSIQEETSAASVHVRKIQQTALLAFHNFANLPHQAGDKTWSPAFTCLGRQWKVAIYPGGLNENWAGEVGLSLRLMGEDRNVKVKCTFGIPRAYESGNIALSERGWECGGVCTRQQALNSLGEEDEALLVHADIVVLTNAEPKWTPRETLRQDIATLFQMPQLMDVTFSVGSTSFQAHRNILSARAPALAALIENVPPGTPMELHNIDASVFKSFLHFIYNDEPPPNLTTHHVLELLDVADHFDCKRLKFLVESELEASLKCDNAAHLLLLADDKDCASLKESAIYHIAQNLGEVRASSGWAQLAESASLLDAILDAIDEQDPTRSAEEDDSDFPKMRVGQLRGMLEERGLDVDGSKDVLIQRLEQAE